MCVLWHAKMCACVYLCYKNNSAVEGFSRQTDRNTDGKRLDIPCLRDTHTHTHCWTHTLFRCKHNPVFILSLYCCSAVWWYFLFNCSCSGGSGSDCTLKPMVVETHTGCEGLFFLTGMIYVAVADTHTHSCSPSFVRISQTLYLSQLITPTIIIPRKP